MMSKNKIEVNMNVYDIPILIEELEKAEDTIKKLQQENQQLKKQKDDVVECIKNKFIEGEVFYSKSWLKMKKKELLRMLGETNEFE